MTSEGCGVALRFPAGWTPGRGTSCGVAAYELASDAERGPHRRTPSGGHTVMLERLTWLDFEDI